MIDTCASSGNSYFRFVIGLNGLSSAEEVGGCRAG